MKTISALMICLALVGLASAAPSEPRNKRATIIAAAPVVAAVGAVPVVHSHVVSAPATTVVKTQQVSSGDHSSYSYSTETKSHPAVVTHTHAAIAAAPAVASVATVPVASVPTYHYGYYPSVYTHGYYSPYHYIVGK